MFVRCLNLLDELPFGEVSRDPELLYESSGKGHVRGCQLCSVGPFGRSDLDRVGEGVGIKHGFSRCQPRDELQRVGTPNIEGLVDEAKDL